MVRAQARQILAQLVLLLVVHIEETYQSPTRRFHFIFNFLKDGAGVVVATHNECVEADFLAPNPRNHRSGDDEARDISHQELERKERDKRLVIRLVVHHFIIKDDHEEQHHHTQKRDKESLSEFLQTRLEIHFLVSSGHGMKDKPTNRDDCHTQPKTRRNKRIGDTIPIVDIEVFMSLAEEIKQGPRQNGGNPIDEEIQTGQSFLIHCGR